MNISVLAALLSSSIYIAAIALLIILYWPTRKTDSLASLPWLLAYWIFLKAFGLLSAASVEFLNSSTSLSIVTTFACIGLLVSSLKYFFIVSLLTTNAAHLLKSHVASPTIQRLADLFRYRAVMGWTLIALAVVPGVALRLVALIHDKA